MTDYGIINVWLVNVAAYSGDSPCARDSAMIITHEFNLHVSAVTLIANRIKKMRPNEMQISPHVNHQSPLHQLFVVKFDKNGSLSPISSTTFLSFSFF